MSTLAFDSLVAQALELSASQRSELADRLMDSLSDEGEGLSEAWGREIDRRLERVRSGESGPVSHREVMDQVRQLISKR